jgi:hypothetical protein
VAGCFILGNKYAFVLKTFYIDCLGLYKDKGMYFFKPWNMHTTFSVLCHFRLSQFLVKFPSLCFKPKTNVFLKNLKLLRNFRRQKSEKKLFPYKWPTTLEWVWALSLSGALCSVQMNWHTFSDVRKTNYKDYAENISSKLKIFSPSICATLD